MKNLKKVLAFVVVFAMMFTFVASANTFPDVSEDASYAEAATILSSLNLMIGDDNGNFNPDKVLTRAEAATLIVRAKGLENAAAGAKGTTAFTDVAADHWASGYINLATQSGIVAGMGDGTFLPESEVTYEQIVKMIVAALGYGPQVATLGGYPTGYLVIASQKNITKGAAGSAGQPAARSIVARLLYNALEVKMMKQTVFTVGAEEYAECDDTLLTTYLGFDKYEGVVTNVSYATTANTTDKTTVTVDYKKMNDVTYNTTQNEEFVEGDTNASALLGYYVTAYAAEDEVSGDLTLYAISAKSGKNDTVTIDYSQIDKLVYEGSDIAGVNYMAKETDKTATKLKLNTTDGVIFYYNGDVDANGDCEDFLQQCEQSTYVYPGTVEFVDYNNDSEYEYVFVTAYEEDYVVNEINTASQTMTDKNGTNIDIDIEDEDVTYSFIKNGAPAVYDDIKVGDVLTFSKSHDESLVKVFISDATVEGTVSEERMDGSEPYYTVAGNEYRVYITGNTPDESYIKVSDQGKFYLNVDNRIVYKDTSSVNSGNYAYLFDADLTTGLGGGTIEIKFLTSEGEWKIASLANRVTVYEGGNSTTIDSAKANAEVGSMYKVDATGNDLVAGSMTQQLFQYDVNSSGYINRLYIADTKRVDDNNFSYDADYADAVYNANNMRLGGTFLSENTIVFNVNTHNGATGWDTDEDNFAVSTVKGTFTDSQTYTSGRFYDKDTNGYPAVVVAIDAKSDIADDTNIFVISKVTEGNNANGYKVAKFYGYQEGASVNAEGSEDGVTYIDRAGNALSNFTLSAGDVAIFSLDAKGCIDKVQVLMTAAEALAAGDADGTSTFDETNNGSDGKVEDAFGFAAKTKTGNRVTLDFFKNVNGAKTAEFALTGSTVKFYTVNLNRVSNPIINAASFGDITVNTKAEKTGSWVYVRYYDQMAVGGVIYNYDNAATITLSAE